ncbi:polyphosphate kinase 2 family protein [Methylotenera sp.]|uniref:polyphosphate kinase 2 family protein n=1 Tax=Methylotenera sp. TaxID=2051956 RepID=UPI002718EE9C|nr:polyphosphate kinase 2 family protein [Methylotenera sp.]MDO9204452.1 polyphosphate kinase 2 family protein [Methylotenera sp.]MDO9393143.1 polyphosphate kinase 2 family protein [Methylotenera sp.]MDP1521943.1 polyphosphate kinase 2 family protein [Methylotenera sp.]MDP2072163.1 polyphosphate kinase 2 family protein [Methylotenera sp.]MDP2231663.1 polyphosphate kinase 2 family protein [Methylotenera sp.]
MTNLNKYRVDDKKFSLKEFKSNDKSERTDSKEQDSIELTKLAAEINTLQDILHAEGKRKLLLVLQGMDASGKDGTVRHVFSECDPLGIRLASFKAPTSEELAHDYLWRVHQQVPKAGELVIFNRSHYEDVLIVKVHDWIDDAECQRRYAQINDFERLLTETGTTIIKCFLHISKEEQKVRMQERLDDPTKSWKFNSNDLKERALWPQYIQAYEQAIQATSTEHAPWYVVPADSKTNRNLLISRLLLDTLKSLKLKYPPVPTDYKSIIIAD